MTATCPYCRAPFEPEDEVVACSACGTTHHADCLAENGGCTVFGCSQAPVEEPKISVTTGDISNPFAPPSAAPPPETRRVPPPPRPTSSIPPPPRPTDQRTDGAIFTSYAPSQPTLGFAGYAPSTSPASPISIYATRKNRVAFVVLAIFFGAFGVHNFYAGYIKKAVIQLCITVFTCFYGSPVIWIWAIVEACMINKDADEIAFT